MNWRGGLVCLTLLALGAPQAALAARAQVPVCRTRADGTWRIAAYGFPGVSALDERSVQPLLGNVDLSERRVRFGRSHCDIARMQTQLVDDQPGFPLRVTITCANQTVVPVFYVGPSCSRIRAALDGAVFDLRRRD